MATSSPPKTLHALGVVRVSRKGDRTDASLRSPGDQAARMRAVAAEMGWTIDVLPHEINISGDSALADRPSLIAAIEAIEAGAAQVLIASETDRLWRSPRVRSEVLERVERVGAFVWSGDDELVTDATSADELSGGVRALVDRFVYRQAKEKSMRGQRAAMEAGIPPLRLPVHLERVGDEIVIADREIGELVATAVRMRADGETFGRIRTVLAGLGLAMTIDPLRRLIANPMVVGRWSIVIDGETFCGTVPAVVDEATWRRAQARRTTRGRMSQVDDLLARTGVLRCASCQHTMQAGSTKGGRYRAYRCQHPDCTARAAISALQIEPVVADAAKAELARWSEQGGASRATELEARREAAVAAQAKLDATIETLSAADLMAEPSSARVLAELREARDLALAAIGELGDVSGDVVRVDAIADWDRLDVDERRELIRDVIAAVWVAPGRGLDRVSIDTF